MDFFFVSIQSCLTANKKGNNKYEFAFDKVFNPDSTQGQVFEEICQLVQVKVVSLQLQKGGGSVNLFMNIHVFGANVPSSENASQVLWKLIINL